MNYVALDTKRTIRTMMRPMVIALFIGLLAYGALGIAHPRSVHANTYASDYLLFACEYRSSGSHPDTVWVAGYNQYGNFVSHQFPAYYTYDWPNYWYWLEGSYVYFHATFQGRTSSESGYVYHGALGTDTLFTSIC